MRKNLYLILGILSTINFVYSFFGNAISAEFFGFQVDIWVYRLIWVLLTTLFFRTYFNLRNNTTQK